MRIRRGVGETEVRRQRCELGVGFGETEVRIRRGVGETEERIRRGAGGDRGAN